MSEPVNKKQNDDRQNAGRRLHLREVSSGDYDGIGADLQAGRVRLGQEIADLSELLRIRQEHLRAIEQGRFSELPAPVYAVGFVRTFAEHVGLNGEDAIRRFKEEAEGLPHHTRLSFPTPEEESRVPRGWLLVVAGIVAVLVYAGWYYAENKDRLNLAEVPKVPERLAEKTVAPEPSVIPQARMQVPAPVVETPIVVEVPAAEKAVQETASAPVVAESVAPVASTEITAEPQIPVVEPAAVVEPVTIVEAVTNVGTSQPQVTAPVISVEPMRVVSAEPTPVVKVEVTPEAPVQPVVSKPVEVAKVIVPAQEPAAAVVVAVPESPVVAETVTPQPTIQAATQPTPTPTPTPEIAATVEPAKPVPAVVAAVQADIPRASSQAGRKAEIFGSPANESRVEVHARVDVWVQVVAENGDTLLSRILRQGDSYFAPANQTALMTTGNAGALQVIVDGKVIQPVGPPGAVRRDVPLDPAQLIDLSTGQRGNADN